MHIGSLSPVYAMEKVEDGFENEDVVESIVSLNNELNVVEESIGESIEESVDENDEGSVKDEIIVNEDNAEEENNSIPEEIENNDSNEIVYNNLVNNESEVRTNSVLNSDTSLSRLKFLSGINLTEEFSKDKYEYEAILSSNRNAIAWGASFSGNETTAVSNNKSTMAVYFNGDLIKDGLTMINNLSIPYIEDGDNILEIVVKAENGDTVTYRVSFTRIKYSDTSLSRLKFLSGISLTEEFDKDKYEYEAIISSNRNAIAWGASFSGNETTAVNANNKTVMDVYFNGDKVKEDITMINNLSIPYIEDGDNILEIVVKAENGDTATYRVSFTRIKYSDTSLSRVGFGGGIKLTEDFDKDKYEYEAIVPSKTTSIYFGASFSSDEIIVLNGNKATMDMYWNGELKQENVTKLYGNPSIPYVDDGENVMTIVITAENGDTATYTINFNRIKHSDTSLTRVGFAGGIKLTEDFDKNKYEYTATVPSKTSSIYFGASFSSDEIIVLNGNRATMDMYWNGELKQEKVTKLYGNPSIPYVDDEENVMTIVVTAENGDTTTYTITFEREKFSDTSLTRLNFINGINLTEEFNKDKYEYEAIISSNRSAIQWGASFSGNETTAVNGNRAFMDVYFNDELIKENVTMLYGFSIPYVEDGENILKIVVTAENGAIATYTVSFTRIKYSDTSLSRLKFLNGISLTEEFDKDKYEYEAILSSNRNAIQWGASFSGNETTAVNANNKTVMDVYFNGNLVKENITMIYNFSIPYVEDGENLLEIVVTAENGDTATYRVSFTRIKYSDTSLSRVGFARGIKLTEDFNKDKYDYKAIVPSGINSIYGGASFSSTEIIVANNNKAAMDVYFNGDLVEEDITKLYGFTFDLVKKKENVLEIVVKAENGDTATYTITFERELDSNTNIKDFSINKGSLELEDDKYIVTMNSWQDISVSKLLLEDSWADYNLVLNGEPISYDEIFDLDFEDNKLEIEVTSNNGSKKSYPVIFEKSDTVSPVINYEVSHNEWINEDVVIDLSAIDDSGIRYIELPNGEKVASDEVKFYAKNNGIYEFKVYDNFLNESIEVIEIDNIDKELPKLDIKASTTELTNDSVDILINTSDNIGIKYIETPDGKVLTKNSLTYTVHEDGTYVFKVVDLAGNEVVKSITLNNIDSVNPMLATELSNDDWSNEELTLSVFAISDKGIKYIELPDGTKVEDNAAEYSINENGVYMVATESLGGNITTEKIVVNNIDTELPTITLKSSTEEWTNDSVDVSINGEDNSGIDYIVLPNGEKVYDSSYKYTIDSNGKYDFTVVDLAGNEYSENIEIDNIDKELPKIELKPSTIELTNNSVDVVVNASDNVGVKYIETPDGEIIDNDNFIYEIYEDGVYTFKVVDHIGNETVKSITINNIDNISPVLTTELSNDNWSNEEVTLNISAASDKGIKYIGLPDGTKVYGDFAEYSISENGTYVITTESLGGNITTEKVVVKNIDTELPTLSFDLSTKEWTNKDVDINVKAEDNVDIDYIILPNGEVISESNYKYSVSSNGKYEFTVFDLAGNKYSEAIEVSNIDKEPPVVESKEDLIDVLSNTIKLDLSNLNTPSGVYKIILPNGEEIVNPTENVITFKVSRNGMYRFVVVDNAGNSLNVDVPVESVKENIYTNDSYVKEDYSLDLKSLNNDITEDVDNISEDEILKNQINDSDDINNNLNKDESDRVTSSSKKNNKIIIGSIIFIAMGSLGYYIINRKK